MGPDSASVRIRKSCQHCRKHKYRCSPGSDGRQPCKRCEDAGIDCQFSQSLRPLPSKDLSEHAASQDRVIASLQAQIERMNDRIILLEGQMNRFNSMLPQVSPSTFDLIQVHGLTEPAPPSNDEASFHSIEGETLGLEQISQPVARTVLDSDSNVPRMSGRLPSDECLAWSTFRDRCLSSLCFLDPSHPFDAVAIKAQSPLLYSAIIAVGSKKAAGLEALHQRETDNARKLLRETVLGHTSVLPTVMDLRGALVFTKWLAPMRPLGHIVDMAFELDIPSGYPKTPEARINPAAGHLEKVRLWLQIVCLDLVAGRSMGRPCHVLDTESVKAQADWLMSLPQTDSHDLRLVASYEYAQLTCLSDSTMDLFSRIPKSDFFAALNSIQAKEQEIEQWHQKWMPIAASFSRDDESYSMRLAMDVNSNFLRLSFSTSVLRGLAHTEMNSFLRDTYMEQSVASARAQLTLCVDQMAVTVINYMPTATLVFVAASAIFLIKILHVLPERISRIQVINEIEQVIARLSHISDADYAQTVSNQLEDVLQSLDRGSGGWDTSRYRVPPNVDHSAAFKVSTIFDIDSAQLADAAQDAGESWSALWGEPWTSWAESLFA